MKLIVGLGNIGKEYEGTRHNIGFMVADELAKRWGITTWKNERSAMCAEHRIPEKVFLIKPTTYMNLSGEAVGAFANFYNIDPEDIARLFRMTSIYPAENCVSAAKVVRAGTTALNPFSSILARAIFRALKSASATRNAMRRQLSGMCCTVSAKKNSH